MSTLAAAIAAYDESLDLLWVGQLVADGPTMAIVEDKQLQRRYLWPGLKAWHGPLPGTEEYFSAESPQPVDETQHEASALVAGQLNLF